MKKTFRLWIDIIYWFKCNTPWKFDDGELAGKIYSYRKYLEQKYIKTFKVKSIYD